MDVQELLPIGSVVRVKEANKDMMIIGVAQISDDEVYDYVAVLYPEGYLSEDEIYLFNREDLESISFLGYVDAQYQVFRKSLNEVIKKEYPQGNEE